MSKRKLIFYDDARHYHYYIFEPPIRLEEATATIPLCQVSCRLKGGLGLARPPGPVLSELRWGRERVTQCHIQRDLKREWSASWPIGMDPVPPSWPRR